MLARRRPPSRSLSRSLSTSKSPSIPRKQSPRAGDRRTVPTFIPPAIHPIDHLIASFSPDPSEQGDNYVPVGRGWSAKELRLKSFDDLHKLWHVLYKERNILATEEEAVRRQGGDLDVEIKQRGRKQMVRKSMGAIRHVLQERKLAEEEALMAEEEEEEEAEQQLTKEQQN